MQEIARDVAVIKTLVSNAYLVGDARRWILLDSLAPGHAGAIKQAAEARFGPYSSPQAIVLTHGHIDHAGCAAELADFWGVDVHAHRLEHPYLTGGSEYPPLDHTAPGFFSAFSRFLPSHTCNLGSRVAELPPDRPLEWLEEWDCHFTPGHSPGHVAFFRPDGNVLLAGDAVATMNLDSFVGTITQRQQVCRPPVPGTPDWQQAHQSIRRLASLQPDWICAGHGQPLFGAAEQLQRLADDFRPPAHGRYVADPAILDENGIRYLPPAPFDATPVLAAVAAVAGVAFVLWRQRESRTD